MIVRYENAEWENDDKYWYVSLDAVCGKYRASSGTIKVKLDYGSNSIQSSLTIAQNVARKRLRKMIEGDKNE